MTDRFEDYPAAIVGENRGTLCWRVELTGPDGELLATSDRAEATGDAVHWPVTSSPAQILADAKAQRSASIELPTTAALIPTDTGGPLHPDSRSKVRIWAGIDVDGTKTWWPQGALDIEEVTGVATAGLVNLTADLVDAVEPVRSKLATAFRFEDDEPVETVVTRILDQIMDSSAYNIPATGETALAGDAEVDDDRFELISDLLDGIGWELVADPHGLVTARPILQSGDDPTARRWRYGGAGEIPVSAVTRVWSARSARVWRAEGGTKLDGDPAPSVTVFDLDPGSQGYFPGLGHPIQVRSTRHPYQGTVGGLQRAAYGQMRRDGIGPGLVQFETLANPAMQQGDLVDLTVGPYGFDAKPHRVLGMSLPYMNRGKMTVLARGAWEPDLGFTTPGLDLDPSCLASYLDDFDRPDGDLELLDGADSGSPLWTEMGDSWGIVGGWAVQRYGGTTSPPNPPWSMAIVDTGLCSADQYAELTVRRLPTGRQIGPVIRNDGSFAGYAAIVRAGEITLELWLNAAKVATLGQATYEGGAEGRTVRVSATGTAIEVTLDSVSVITATDDRLTGNRIGMLAYGGAGDAAPAAQPFAGGST